MSTNIMHSFSQRQLLSPSKLIKWSNLQFHDNNGAADTEPGPPVLPLTLLREPLYWIFPGSCNKVMLTHDPQPGPSVISAMQRDHCHICQYGTIFSTKCPSSGTCPSITSSLLYQQFNWNGSWQSAKRSILFHAVLERALLVANSLTSSNSKGTEIRRRQHVC